MPGELVVSQQVLGHTSTRLAATADRLDAARGRLEGRLSAIGPCWGTSDQVASTFVREYVRPRGDLLEASGDLGTVLRGLSDRTRWAARVFAGVEDDNTALAHGSGAGHGSGQLG